MLETEMKKRWKQKDIWTLKKFYPDNGARKTSIKLGFSESSVAQKASSMKLRISKIRRKYLNKRLQIMDHKAVFTQSISDFISCKNKETAYILGFLWADGSLNKASYRTTLEIIKEDFLQIERCLDALNLNIKKSQRTRKGKKTTMFSAKINSKHIYEFLDLNGYSKKAGHPTILSCIPDWAMSYWFRGIVDGDGCFYINKKNRCYRFVMTGPYEQNWDYFIQLFNRLGITNYRIHRKKQHKNSNSRIMLTRRGDIAKIGFFLYGGNFDGIGLNRKYEKYLSISDGVKQVRQ